MRDPSKPSGAPSAPSRDGQPQGDSDRTDSNGQQNVEDRPGVSVVTPDDYPDKR